MTHHCTVLFAGFVLVAAAAPAAAAPPPPDGIEILVAAAPQPRYAHNGRWYVEAIKGREYAIRLRNPYGVRVAVALSVDGLNTIDARHTSASDARKWVLGPYETVTISGWQTSRTEARRFEFTNEEQSYGKALGQTENLGLITAVFFKERVAETARRREVDSPAARSMPLPAAPRPSASPGDAAGANSADKAQASSEALAATGMGRATEHIVTQVQLDLESAPARTVNVRYEFRSQLVRLGILPAARPISPLERRERARGFEGGFSPVPRGW
ncbi:MAG: hypothetical protein ABL986_01480 [Vicinamibacterales bacterium]